MNDTLLIMATKWVTPIFLAACVYLLLDFRNPVRKWKICWLAAAGLIMMINGLLMLTEGFRQIYPAVWPLTVTAPFIIITVTACAKRDLKLIFNFVTILLFGCVNAGMGTVAAHISGFIWADPAVRLAAGFPCLFLIRRYRQAYLSMLRFMKKDWAGSLLPTAFLCLAFFLLSNISGKMEAPVVWLLFSLLTLLSFSYYYILYLFFKKVLSEQMVRQNQQLLAVQAKTLRLQEQSYTETEAKARILRHDLKHYENLLNTHLSSGQKDEALKILREAKEKFRKDLYDREEDG